MTLENFDNHLIIGKKAIELAHAFGYLREPEVMALQLMARTLKDGDVYVNIGAGTGTSSLAVREARPGLNMFTVDISEGGPLGGLQNEVNAFAHTGLVLPNQILGDSFEVGMRWSKKIDLLFIDAGHLESEISGDIEAWFPHLRIGGIVIYHDYCLADEGFWPAVKTVVDIKMKSQEKLFVVDTVAVFRKVK
jgi:predicted O-methyltransferase YrrM